MPRFFLGNFEFEHQLASPSSQLSVRLERINAELASSWVSIADDGDYLWTPQRLNPEFVQQLVAAGLPHVVCEPSFGRIPAGTECVPWGWTDAIRRLCQKNGWRLDAPDQDVVRKANSRRFSFTLESEARCGLDLAGEVASLIDLQRRIASIHLEDRWVIKAEFGMSGRERLLGRGPLTETQMNWARKRIDSDGVVFFEPWVDRIDEVGIQIDIPRHGEPRLVGFAPMVVDSGGQYGGSWCLPIESQTNRCMSTFWMPCARMAIRAAERLQTEGYFGPLGIDAMQYRDREGAIRLRPLQDINARWTMGRLSLGMRQHSSGHQAGCWLRGAAAKQNASNQHNVDSTTTESIFRIVLDSLGIELDQSMLSVVAFISRAVGRFNVDQIAGRIESSISPRTISNVVALRCLHALENEGLIRKVGSPSGDEPSFELVPQDFREIAMAPSSIDGT